MRILRTPDSAFDQLPGWEWGEPSYFVSRLFGAEVRMAYWDLGDDHGGETVLLPHGEPAWSYLNRRMVAPLLSEGYRVVMFDQVGFGRSDKPSEVSDYSYARHVAWNEDLLFHFLDLRNITAVLQDWGGLLGLRVAARNPDRFARLVLSNTVFPTSDPDFEGPGYITQGFYDWKQFVHRGGLANGNLGKLFSRAAKGPSCGPSGELSPDEIAAYQAPFPSDELAAGAFAFPELVPTPSTDPTGRPQSEGGELNKRLWAVFEQWDKPVLLAFGANDPVLGAADYLWRQKCPGTRGVPHVTLKGAGHFSQDGGGQQLVAAVIGFIQEYRQLPRAINSNL
eukprot:TRINITY_DN14187_c0_g1_i1.p1 TRINITY_DN14187_c0_g1~~TRINITY_DN14187_c0_g1_i1.p1  ORF type:complete len:337 (+),score=52.00 TRINITY_DN14187_c0_g1_i1:141-1151(+)